MTEETATIKRRTEMAGQGCAIQGVALLIPFAGLLFGIAGFVVGCVIALVLFLVGSAKSFRYVCSACGNTVPDRQVTVCAACRARFPARK